MDQRARCGPRARTADWARTDGFFLVEAVVAAGLIALVSAGVAQLLVVSQRATAATSRETVALFLAVQKIEQLHGLTWSYRSPGVVRTSDLSTDVAVDTPGAFGARVGVGLRTATAGTLFADVPGYVDYLDSQGEWLGAGTVPSSGFAYVRRWSVRAHSRAPQDLLVLDVVVLSAQWVGRTGGAKTVRSDLGVVWMTALKGRR